MSTYYGTIKHELLVRLKENKQSINLLFYHYWWVNHHTKCYFCLWSEKDIIPTTIVSAHVCTCDVLWCILGWPYTCDLPASLHLRVITGVYYYLMHQCLILNISLNSEAKTFNLNVWNFSIVTYIFNKFETCIYINFHIMLAVRLTFKVT